MRLILLILSICAIAKVVELKTINSNIRITNEIELEALRSDVKHFRKFVPIAYRLDSICNVYKSSRELKQKLSIKLID